jgi:NADH dehydrogenase/NADH:ubiquinone oxidoreductase subunit G
VISITQEIKLNIDGSDVVARSGMTVMEAAEGAGIYIPKLCNHPDLLPFGACRLCITKIEKMKGLPCACTTPATDGMNVITTDSDLNLRAKRRMYKRTLFNKCASQ